MIMQLYKQIMRGFQCHDTKMFMADKQGDIPTTGAEDDSLVLNFFPYWRI